MDSKWNYNASNGTLYDYYCADDSFIQLKTGPLADGSYRPACEFPMINKGFANQSDYEPDDCSMTYADALKAHGKSYATLCLMYTIPSFISLMLTLYIAKVMRQKRLKRSLKKMSTSEVIINMQCVAAFALTIFSIDILEYSELYPTKLWNIFCGLAVGLLSSESFVLVSSWIVIVNMKGKVNHTPSW